METMERAVNGTMVGKIEADMFCADCGYNLHMLDVVRDERLGIAIVQCPECGKYHPAGHATGAGRVWLNRLASLLIAAWVLLLVVGVLGLGFFSGVLDVMKIEGFVMRAEVINPHPIAPGAWSRVYVPAMPRNTEDAWLMFIANSAINAASITLGFLGGMALAALLPHVGRRHVVWLLFMPLAAVCVVSFGFYMDRQRYGEGMKWFITSRLVLEFFLQCMGLIMGARFGRPVARGMLRVALSRRLLQYVRPLWEVDGKVPPGIKPST